MHQRKVLDDYNIQSHIATKEPVYYGHLGTNKNSPDYQGVLIFQVILYDKAGEINASYITAH